MISGRKESYVQITKIFAHGTAEKRVSAVAVAVSRPPHLPRHDAATAVASSRLPHLPRHDAATAPLGGGEGLSSPGAPSPFWDLHAEFCKPGFLHHIRLRYPHYLQILEIMPNQGNFAKVWMAQRSLPMMPARSSRRRLCAVPGFAVA
jgi:hypothetical protein